MMVRRARKVEQPIPAEVAFVAVVPAHWDDDALCKRGVHSDAWYPTHYHVNGADTTHVAALKAACRACPVRAECLITALRTEGVSSDLMRHGVRGGMRPDERADAYRADWRRLEEKRRRHIPACGLRAGKASGVKRHRNMRTELCGPCRAYADAARAGNVRQEAVSA